MKDVKRYGIKGIKRIRNGIRLDTVTAMLVALVLVISGALLFISYHVYTGYDEMTRSMDRYIENRESAMDMMAGSDELTDSVRLFVMTGDTKYIWDYCNAADVSGRRDRALLKIYNEDPDSAAYLALQKSMDESMALMTREYYAMRLIISARNIKLNGLPGTLRYVVLTDKDTLLSPEEKEEKARTMLFDDEYQTAKKIIDENTRLCIGALQEQSRRQVSEMTVELNYWLKLQWLLIVLEILSVAFSALVIQRLALHPLQRGVSMILAKKPLADEGAQEFRTLAKAYNALLAETNQREETLAYNATHDALTGLYNRSGYDYFCDKVDFSTSAMVMIDIDSFKAINDTYGHLDGDRVLCRVANLLRANFRENDLLFRFGGDEFVVIMRKSGPLRNELIRQKIRQINKALQNPNERIPTCSISAGVAFGREHIGPEELMQLADEAMYQVKSGGKRGCAFSTA